MGVFEIEVFLKGIFGVVKVIVESNVIKIVGGGDFVVVVEVLGYVGKMMYILMGGGVSLEYL